MNRRIPTRIIPCLLLLVVCCGDDNEDAAQTIDAGALDGGIRDGDSTDGDTADGTTTDGSTAEGYEPAYQPADLQEGQMELPLPTGRYRVGLSERVMTPGDGVPNETDAPIAPFMPYFTRIFFPVDPAYTGETLAIDSGLFQTGIPGYVTCGTSEEVLTHTYPDAEMVSGEDRFPVVLFAPGGGMPIDLYLSILEDLASHGYVVVAFQPEGTFAHISAKSTIALPDPPDPCAATEEEWRAYYEATIPVDFTQPWLDEASTIVGSMLADAVHTLDQIEQLDRQDPAGVLTGRLDLEKAGMFGHSAGGATAREACVTDLRFKACGNLDGAFYGEHVDAPLARPLMIQLREEHSNLRVLTLHAGYMDLPDATIQTVWDAQDAPAWRIAIRDIDHFSFADSFVIDQHFVWNDEPAGDDACLSKEMESLAAQCINKEDYIKAYVGTLDQARAIEISRAYTLAFFDKHLKGIDRDLLKGPSADYPEVTFEANNVE